MRWKQHHKARLPHSFALPWGYPQWHLYSLPGGGDSWVRDGSPLTLIMSTILFCHSSPGFPCHACSLNSRALPLSTDTSQSAAWRRPEATNEVFTYVFFPQMGMVLLKSYSTGDGGKKKETSSYSKLYQLNCLQGPRTQGTFIASNIFKLYPLQSM